MEFLLLLLLIAEFLFGFIFAGTGLGNGNIWLALLGMLMVGTAVFFFSELTKRVTNV